MISNRKIQRLNKKMKHRVKATAKKAWSKRPHRRVKQDVASRFDEAVKVLPKITNDTVAAHREEVLSTARKYIYPLSHSKHRIVIISSSLFVIFIIGFFTYCGFALYRFQSQSSFLYGVTQVIPFPIAKVGTSYVEYENYLFELRHYVHYYETQQKVDFNSVAGKQQLDNFKKQAMQEIIDDTYVKQLAAENHVSVSNQDIDNEITLVRNQDRLGNNQKEFEDVLNEFWGWSINDFKRELKGQLLAQKVVAQLDTATQKRAQTALQALQNGADFGTIAAQDSDDITTKTNGGQFGFTIDQSSQSIPPQTLSTLLSLKPGQTSGIVNIGTGLEIDKVISNTDGKIQAAHILFNFQSINVYLQPLMAKEKPHIYISQKS
jgi:hypothetical protein